MTNLRGEAHKFILDAASYWNAARVTLQSGISTSKLMWPNLYLLSMSTELALKAYLISRGVRSDTLKRKPYGHHLQNLLEKCFVDGLKITRMEAEIVVIMHQPHLDHFFRYGSTRPYGHPDALLMPHDRLALVHTGYLIDHIAEGPFVLRDRFGIGETFLEWPISSYDFTAITSYEYNILKESYIDKLADLTKCGTKLPRGMDTRLERPPVRPSERLSRAIHGAFSVQHRRGALLRSAAPARGRRTRMPLFVRTFLIDA